MHCQCTCSTPNPLVKTTGRRAIPTSKSSLETSISPDLPVLGERFVVRRVLGRGGFGLVYEAFDRRLQSLVALKTLRKFTGERLLALKREFRALTDLRHENLVRLHELHRYGEEVFFTMELLEGVSFLRYVRSGVQAVASSYEHGEATALVDASGEETLETSKLESPAGAPRQPLGTLDESRLRAVLPQLVRGLVAVHETGRVHCDVKPSNVLINATGRAVLLDFGLVADLGSAAIRTSDAVQGTVAYMAPEQAAGAALGPASDFYALGVMLFEALVGFRPHRGHSASVLRAKQQSEPLPPVFYAPDAPADLSSLCVQLLRRDPAQRLDAEAILARLGEAAGPTASAHEVRPPERGSQPFVGREPELAALASGLAEIASGRTAAFLIEGAAGLGKTALMEQFLEQHAGVGALVLRGRCYEQEALPFKAFDGAIDDLSQWLGALDAIELAAVLPPDLEALLTAFPVLRNVSPSPPDVSELSALANYSELRIRAFGALKSLLRTLAGERQVLVGIDDLQWADDDSLALLEELWCSDEPVPVLLIATARPLDSSVTSSSSDRFSRTRARTRHLVLGGLSERQSRELLEALHPGGAAQAVLRALPREAEGHPLFLHELLQFYVRGGVGSPLSLEEVLGRRIASLELPAQRVLEIVALAGVPVVADIVAAAAEQTPAECLRWLDLLRVARLVSLEASPTGVLAEAYHDRVRETVEHAIAGGSARMAARQRPAMHLTLGRLLYERHATELDVHAFSICRHWNLARDALAGRERLRAADLNWRAARAAKRSTAYDTAAMHLAIAEELLPGDSWESVPGLSLAILATRMEIEHFRGDTEASRALFELGLERSRDVLTKADLYERRVVLDTNWTQNAQALAVGREALALLGERIPQRGSSAAVLRELARFRWRRRRLTDGELVAMPTCVNAQKRAASSILMAMTVAAHQVDPELMSVILLRIANIGLEHGACSETPWGFVGIGVVLSGAMRAYRTAARYGELAFRLCERVDDEALRARLEFAMGYYIAPWVGTYEDAEALVDAGYQRALRVGDFMYVCYTAACDIALQLFRGSDLAMVQDDALRRLSMVLRRPEHDLLACLLAQLWLCSTLRGTALPVVRGAAVPATIEDLRASVTAAQAPICDAYSAVLIAAERFLTGDYTTAWHWSQHAHQRRRLFFSNPSLAEHFVFRGLIAAALFAEASFWRRRRLTAVVNGACRYVDSIARSSPANFSACALMLRGERARIYGRPRLAARRAAAAVATARMYQLPRWEALASEQLARVRERLGEQATAAWDDARRAYRCMGATAKAEQLGATNCKWPE